ncbi:MAG TPA: DUF4232 domain-containing protein [Solirubrobacteraceae bacterium]|nr:DUF4232 domain-containing protein [Solirubrobacteraceae bacterium]
MRIKIIGLAALAALVLTACGGSGGGQTSQASQPSAATAGHTATAPAGTQSQTPTQGQSQSQAASTTTSSSAAATSTAAQSSGAQPNGGAGIAGASNPCKASGLALSFLGGQGATGHGELGFALKNTGAACETGGYPGIQFLGKDGAALPTTPQHTTSDFFGNLPRKALSLEPGQIASFRLGVSHGGGSDAGCNTAYGLQVIAPNDTATLRVQIPNGASECGATTVSPLQPGSSAYR